MHDQTEPHEHTGYYESQDDSGSEGGCRLDV